MRHQCEKSFKEGPAMPETYVCDFSQDFSTIISFQFLFSCERLYISVVALSAQTQFTLPERLDKIFLFLLRLFSVFLLACTFFTWHFVKHNRKWNRICKLLSCLNFTRSG